MSVFGRRCSGMDRGLPARYLFWWGHLGFGNRKMHAIPNAVCFGKPQYIPIVRYQVLQYHTSGLPGSKYAGSISHLQKAIFTRANPVHPIEHSIEDRHCHRAESVNRITSKHGALGSKSFLSSSLCSIRKVQRCKASMSEITKTPLDPFIP